MGSPYFMPQSATHHPSPPSSRQTPDLPGHRATSLHRTTTALAGLPSCVTPSLPTTGSGPRSPQHPRRERKRFRMVGITGLGMDAPSRAREYQPVCPSTTPVGLALGPAHPGRTNLAQEPLVNRQRDSRSAFATHACILTPTPSTPGSHKGFTGRRTAPLPNKTIRAPKTQSHCHSFGGTLEPRYIVGAGPLDQ